MRDFEQRQRQRYIKTNIEIRISVVSWHGRGRLEVIVHLLRDNKDKDRINNKTKIKRERGLEVTLFQKPASQILVKASIVTDTEITST